MLRKLVKNIIGSINDRELNRFWPIVDQINLLEPKMTTYSDAELMSLTSKFKEQLTQGNNLDNLLPEAFAAVREAAKRTINQRHFDVQLIGGIALHEGKIIEMKTGEGKTLAATLPVYLNGLTKKGVHIVTVNDYLANRDANWMGSIYRFLGLSVSCILHKLNDVERQQAYSADITYGTNNEFGFDYLRDNMKFDIKNITQRNFYYAIIDEVDSILIDEARTPLIISGPAEKSTKLYYNISHIIHCLIKNKDYIIDEKSRTVNLTDDGIFHCEQLLNLNNLYDPKYIEILHHLQQALKAHTLFKRDVDYIINNGEIIIVDEFTGRLMPGRRYSDGLHQALEAKENLKIATENQTLATITFQNYFRMYKKLAGMTGTADTEAEEFYKIYKLKVVVIPTHNPMIRLDYPDIVYRTEKDKFDAVVNEIKKLHQKYQPVLVGTISIEKSEMLSEKLKLHGVKHTILNAKHHAHEAEIIAQAGRKGAVTISTNMAGRGTDIILGGNPEFLSKQKNNSKLNSNDHNIILQRYEKICAKDRKDIITLGGLHILGTERHESRRIDNQLRGRSGRQGDPGSSRFYLSLEDDLLRLFGSDRISKLMKKLGMENSDPIETSIITKAIENAQYKVEIRNFEIRKNLLQFDDVLNKQREIIYTQRRQALTTDNINEIILDIIESSIKSLVTAYGNKNEIYLEREQKSLESALLNTLNLNVNLDNQKLWTIDELINFITNQAKDYYQKKNNIYDKETISNLERTIFLHTIDSLWNDHLLNMDYLKEGISLRGYGQKDPLREYQREGYNMFIDMIERIKTETINILFRMQINQLNNIDKSTTPPNNKNKETLYTSNHNITLPYKSKKNKKNNKIGRNSLCPCGSGKKYKKCCQ